MDSRYGGLGVKSWAGRTAMAMACAVAALAGCSKTNAAFCEAPEECAAGQVCEGNRCIEASDGAPADDASPSCPAATHQCLPLAPADWSGPTRRAELAAEDALPACAITDPGGLVAGAGFDADGSCECSCSTAATITCTQGSVESVPGPGGITCNQAQCSGGCESQILPANTCISRVEPTTAQPNLRFRAGNVSGGTCEPGTASAVTPAANFLDRVALCAAPVTDGDCGAQSICAPLPEAGFSGASCIFREGEHECPAAFDFSERTVTFGSLADGRACESCDCELPVGSSCKGGVEGFASGICSGSSDLSQGLGCTATSTWNGLAGFKYAPVASDVDCAPSNATTGVTGEITGVDPVTVCCTAPL